MMDMKVETLDLRHECCSGIDILEERLFEAREGEILEFVIDKRLKQAAQEVIRDAKCREIGIRSKGNETCIRIVKLSM